MDNVKYDGYYLDKIRKDLLFIDRNMLGVTKPEFEIYDETLRVLRDRLFITYATRLPSLVIIEFYMVEAG